jgi:hypothetical protein
MSEKNKVGRPCASDLGEGKERGPSVWYPAGQLARLKAEAEAAGISFAEHVRRLLGATKRIGDGAGS